MNGAVSEDKYFIYEFPRKCGFRQMLKTLYVGVLRLFYGMRLARIGKKERASAKYRVSLCGIFKNEAPYLKEWIEYHLIVGVDHFYLYNNHSEDAFRETLEPYICRGIVSLIEWPYDQKQMEAYRDCIKRYAAETKWLGFVDIDEFVTPKNTDNVYDFLKAFQNRGSVLIYWKIFGSSGLRDRDPEGLVTEVFTAASEKYYELGKCFLNTAFTFDESSVFASQMHHKLWTVYNGRRIPPVNVFIRITINNMHQADEKDFPIQINHYILKSKSEYEARCKKGDVYYQKNPHDDAYFQKFEAMCHSCDLSAYRFLARLKENMRK